MKVEALPNYRPDCAECGCPMDIHFGDAWDAGCWHVDLVADEPCQCRGYRYPHEVVSVAPQEQPPGEMPRGADGDPVCSECSMPEPAEWCWRQSVSCPFGKPPRSQT
jgi:hypothetical protein